MEKEKCYTRWTSPLECDAEFTQDGLWAGELLQQSSRFQHSQFVIVYDAVIHRGHLKIINKILANILALWTILVVLNTRNRGK